ncbi:MAG: ABC transporter permease [Gammaproteobacteria bacterium]|nr:ABC transporter permease [Gammaproteobacteria bacterium]|tara:strand:+ start:1741 stop:2658 length:918 start_codon:yes stop_codon:yes gene_type:complete
MSQYIFKRLWQGAIAIIGALLIVFVAQRLAGDPVALMLPMEATEEDFAAMRAQLGLDRPFIVQFGIFFMDALRGEFGTSYHWNQPAMDLLLDRLPATLELAMAGLVFAIALSVPLGVLSAVYRGGWIDSAAKIFAMLGQAMPSFWVGLLLIVLIAVELQWLPAYGRGTFAHLILPAIALGWYPVAAMTRTLRSSMLDILESDYVRMERAIGLPEGQIVWRYALRNAAVPLVTMIGVYFANMLGGAFVIEVVFAWPGVGRTVVEAVFARDFPVVQAGVVLASVVFVVVNLLVDLSYGFIDPRIRHD